MKKGITRLLSLTLALSLGMSISLLAQNDQSDQTEVVIVQKIIADDGTETIIKKRMYAGDDAKTYISENHDELSSMWEGNEEEGTEHYMIIRRDDDGRKKEVVIQMDGAQDRQEWQQEQEENHFRHRAHEVHKSKGNKAFMGVYPEGNPMGEGVMLDGIVNYSGAQKAGLNTGDVMISINDFELVEQNDLGRALAQHEPGETVTVTYVRNGQTMQTQVALTSRGNYDRLERDPCQVFIGVSLGRQHAAEGKGINVSSVISETSAETYGVQSGDVIVRLDDVSVNTYDELLIERNKHQPGDWYTLTVLRFGNPMDIELQFNSCEEEEEEEIIELIEEPVVEEIVEVAPDVEERQPELINGALELINFKAFPNPTYGMVQVQFEGKAIPTNVRITDVAGRVVYKENLNSFNGTYNQEVNLSKVSPGTLILTITQEGRAVSDKIILLPKA